MKNYVVVKVTYNADATRVKKFEYVSKEYDTYQGANHACDALNYYAGDELDTCEFFEVAVVDEDGNILIGEV